MSETRSWIIEREKIGKGRWQGTGNEEKGLREIISPQISVHSCLLVRDGAILESFLVFLQYFCGNFPARY